MSETINHHNPEAEDVSLEDIAINLAANDKISEDDAIEITNIFDQLNTAAELGDTESAADYLTTLDNILEKDFAVDGAFEIPNDFGQTLYEGADQILQPETKQWLNETEQLHEASDVFFNSTSVPEKQLLTHDEAVEINRPARADLGVEGMEKSLENKAFDYETAKSLLEEKNVSEDIAKRMAIAVGEFSKVLLDESSTDEEIRSAQEDFYARHRLAEADAMAIGEARLSDEQDRAIKDLLEAVTLDKFNRLFTASPADTEIATDEPAEESTADRIARQADEALKNGVNGAETDTDEKQLSLKQRWAYIKMAAQGNNFTENLRRALSRNGELNEQNENKYVRRGIVIAGIGALALLSYKGAKEGFDIAPEMIDGDGFDFLPPIDTAHDTNSITEEFQEAFGSTEPVETVETDAPDTTAETAPANPEVGENIHITINDGEGFTQWMQRVAEGEGYRDVTPTELYDVYKANEQALINEIPSYQLGSGDWGIQSAGEYDINSELLEKIKRELAEKAGR